MPASDGPAVHRRLRAPRVALIVLTTVVASFPVLGTPASASVSAPPAPERAERGLGVLLHPVLNRRFEASNKDVLVGRRGRLVKVVSGQLPRGIRISQGVLVGRATRLGLVTTRIQAENQGRRSVRTVSFRVLRPEAARAGTRLVTTSKAGSPAGRSTDVDVSADGGVVTFTSNDAGLVPGDDNNAPDVFAWTRSTGRVTLVSRAVGGRAGDGESGEASVSADGRYVAFSSSATDLTSEPGSGRLQVYVRDLATGVLATTPQEVRSVSMLLDPQLLDDGSVVFGVSYVNDQTGKLDHSAWRWEPASARVAQLPGPSDRGPLAGVSGDGRWLLWVDDSGVLVTDASTGADRGSCAFPSSFVFAGDASFSADGVRVVVDGKPLRGRGDIRAHCEPATGVGGVAVGTVGMTADGATVAQTGFARGKAPAAYLDVRVGGYPRATASVFRHGTSTTSAEVAISADGSTVVYTTNANNVLDADRDRTADVFVLTD
jgi:WD40-like Beta Propeller Repeat